MLGNTDTTVEGTGCAVFLDEVDSDEFALALGDEVCNLHDVFLWNRCDSASVMALIEDHHRTLAVSKLFKYNSDGLLCIFTSAEGFFDGELNNTINPFGDDAVADTRFHFGVAVPHGVGFGDVHVSVMPQNRCRYARQ